MLRLMLLAAALTTCALGLAARLAGHRDGLPMAIWGGLVAAADLVERWRYRQSTSAPGDGWVKTDERFIDPESGRPVRVSYNARTGERRYDAD